MAKGGYVQGNTSPVGEINREVVAPPGAAADGARLVEQTFMLQYRYTTSSGAVYRMENPHDVPMFITGIFHRVTTAPSAGGSSGVIKWATVATSSAVGTNLGSLGRFSSSIGITQHFPGSSGFTIINTAVVNIWEKNGNSSGAWLTGAINGLGLFAGSSARAQAFVTAIPMYST